MRQILDQNNCIEDILTDKKFLNEFIELSLINYFRSSTYLDLLLEKDIKYDLCNKIKEHKYDIQDEQLKEFREYRISKIREILDDYKENEDSYIKKLTKTLLNRYKYFIIRTEQKFILSDSYISVASGEYEKFYLDRGNCNIGMPKTLVLIPISSDYYLMFYNDDIFGFNNKKTYLTEEETYKINSVIYRNSFLHCICENENILTKIKNGNIFKTTRYKIVTGYETMKNCCQIKNPIFFKEDIDLKILINNIEQLKSIDTSNKNMVKFKVVNKFKFSFINAENKTYQIENNIWECERKDFNRLLLNEEFNGFFITMTSELENELKNLLKTIDI